MTGLAKSTDVFTGMPKEFLKWMAEEQEKMQINLNAALDNQRTIQVQECKLFLEFN